MSVKIVIDRERADRVEGSYREDPLSTNTCHSCVHCMFADDPNVGMDKCMIVQGPVEDDGTCSEYEVIK